MTKTARWMMLVAMGTLALGCKKLGMKGSGEGGADDTSGGGAKVTKIDEAGVQFTLPPDTKLGDVTALMGSYTYPCCGGGTTIQVNPVKADSLTAAKNIDDAKKSADIFDKAKVTKSEATADGWRVEYDHDSGMGHTYDILIRHTFSGNAFDCEADSTDAAKVKIAAKACESLTPIPGGKMVATAGGASAAAAAMAGAPGAAGGAGAPPGMAGGAAVGVDCPKAVKCCKVLSGDSAPSCDSLAKAGDAACTSSLQSFVKAVKATKPKRIAECQ